MTDRRGDFAVFPLAMVLIDGHAWAGPGVRDQVGANLVPMLMVRSGRLGMAARLYRWVSMAFVAAAARQPVANDGGTDQRTAGTPGVDPDANSARYEGAQGAANRV